MGYGMAIMMLVTAGLGAASWNVLSDGIASVAGISFGMATNIVGLGVLGFWIPLRELPGLGTVLNVLLVGVAADITDIVLPTPSGLPRQAAMLVSGLILLSVSDALYLGAQFGAGPRDGLMTGLVRMTGRPVWAVRTAIEVVVACIGWFLGGTIGIGTVCVALGMGPLVGFLLPRTSIDITTRSPHPVEPNAGDAVVSPQKDT